MDEALIVILVVLGILLVVGVLVAAWYFEKKRREELVRWARENGFRFSPGKRRRPRLPFSVFGQGHSRYSRYHMTKTVPEAVPGLDQADLDIFEYHYAITTHTGKSSSTSHYHFTCAHVDAGPDLGEVTIRKEHLGDKLVQAIGFDDIDFEDGEFSRKFVVKARDRKRAYSLVNPRMMEFLKAHPGWRIETSGAWLFVYCSGKPNARRNGAILRFTRGFLAAIPRTLVNEERERRGLPPAVDAGQAARYHEPGDAG